MRYMMRILFGVLLATATVAAIGGCSDDGDPIVGSESHWLSCNTTSECPTGHTCVSGECRPVLEASGYEQSCQTDSDCTVITEGDFCTCVGCPNAAINISDKAAYETDMQAALDACADSRTSCGSLRESHTRKQALSCGLSEALCIKGTCELFQIDTVEESVDRTCQVDSDCVVAPMDFCQPCACQVAVSQEGLAVAERIREKLDCGGSTAEECACADPGPPECINGTCYTAGGGQGCNLTAWDSAICE